MDWGYVAGYFDGEGCVEYYKPGNAKSKKKRCAITFHNTNRASLEAIQEFIECGNLRERKRAKLGTKSMYQLSIERRVHLVRVIPKMLEHSIIKREILAALLEQVSLRRDESPGFGNLAAAGPDEIRRLYWNDRLSMAKIAKKYGVTWGAVKMFMRRHDIPTRTHAKAALLVERTEQQNKRLAETKRQQWQDPMFRQKMIAAIKAGQAKRLASRQKKHQRTEFLA